MPALDLKTKAQHFLDRRDAPDGIGFYIRHHGGRQVLFFFAYAAIVSGLWFLNRPMSATIVAAFYVGRSVRDVQWWRVMAREWPTTARFVDWQKVEATANDHTKGN